MTDFGLAPVVIRNAAVPGANTLTDAQLYKFSDGLTTTSGVLVSGTIAIDAVLINRFRISEVRYYYSGPSAVSFYSSQNGDAWDALAFSTVAGYAVVSGALAGFYNWPSVVRVVQTDVTASSYGYELDIRTEGQDIGFGQDGLSSSVQVDCSVDAEASPIPIRNMTCLPRDIFCFVSDDSTNQMDETISMSTSVSGPYVSKWERGIQVPRDFSWLSGGFSGTQVNGSYIGLSPSSGTGYYYTPVFEVTGMLPFRAYWTSTLLSNTSIDWLSQADDSSTMGVRWSLTSPVGVWAPGSLPEASDPLWGTLSGTLSYTPVRCATILPPNPPGCRRFFQAAVRLNSIVVGVSPLLMSVGIEEATVLSGVLSDQAGTLYVKTNVSSYARGNSSDILTFFLG